MCTCMTGGVIVYAALQLCSHAVRCTKYKTARQRTSSECFQAGSIRDVHAHDFVQNEKYPAIFASYTHTDCK